MNDQLPDLTQYLASLERQRYFGKVELSYEAGKLTSLKETKTLKPADLIRREHRGNDERSQSR